MYDHVSTTVRVEVRCRRCRELVGASFPTALAGVEFDADGGARVLRPVRDDPAVAAFAPRVYFTTNGSETVHGAERTRWPEASGRAVELPCRSGCGAAPRLNRGRLLRAAHDARQRGERVIYV